MGGRSDGHMVRLIKLVKTRAVALPSGARPLSMQSNKQVYRRHRGRGSRAWLEVDLETSQGRR